MNTEDKRTVPLAGSTARPWLWQIWMVVVVLFVIVLGIHFVLPPPLAITPPTLSFLGDTCRVSFHANNHTNRLTVAALLVTVGDGTPATRYLPPTYSEFARRTVPLNLAPKEDRDFACEFPITVHPFPNVAQVEIAPFAIPNP